MATILLKIRSLGLNPLYIVQSSRGLRGNRYQRDFPASDDMGVDTKKSDFLAQLEKEAKTLRTKFGNLDDDPDGNSKLRRNARTPILHDLREEDWAKKANLKSRRNPKTSENQERTESSVLEGERNPKASEYAGRNPKISKHDESHPKASRNDESYPKSSRNLELISDESNNHNNNTTKAPPLTGVFADIIKDLRSKTNFAEVTLENKDDKVKDVMTVLHSFHYAEQLKLKYHKTTEVLDRLTKGLTYSVKRRCEVEKVIRSPLREGYRSKDEFSVQVGVDGKPTVGFFVGNPRDGLVCVEPDSISIIKDSHKLVAKCYQNYIRESSLPAHLYMGPIAGGEQGNWRSMYVRSNEAGDLMGKIIFHPQLLSDHQIQEEKDRLVEYFTSGDGRVCGLKSLYIVVTKDLFNTASKDRPALLFGLSHITETMDGITFRLGPETFYQINVKCAELLLGVVKQEANLNESRTLLDLCCGAGFFSIHLAKLVRGCLGVDMFGIEDARENAELNGATNCSFLKGKVQEVVPGLLQQLGPVGGSVSVVLNPGREGVDFRVIRELRRSLMIDTVVYVSCQPEGKAFINFRELLKDDVKGTPAKLRSEPFQLKKVIPIDMFPHTQHCEHVFVFRR